MLDGSVMYLVLGIAIGVLLTAKSVKDVVEGLPEAVVPYTMYGLLLFGATAAIGWAGFTCVVMAFVFYHAIGREGWSQALQTFFSFKWLRRKEVTPPPAVENHEIDVDAQVLLILRADPDSAFSKNQILAAMPDGMVDNEGNTVGASLTRLLAANSIKADENGLYTPMATNNWQS